MPAGSRPARLRRLLLGALALAALGRPLAAADTWLSARTAHFEMFSSASESESRRLLLALEQFRANFLASFPLRGAAEPHTTVVLFRTEREFRPYTPLFGGKPKAVAGYFLPGDDAVMIALTTDLDGGDTDPTEVIYHEYLHLLLHVRGTPVPVWLNEGLAELFSTFHLDGDKVEFGAAKDNHVAVLSQSALLPLAKLFAVTRDSPDYNEEHRAGLFYAQAWALTHYLVCGADRANSAKLARFISRLGESGGTEASFREAFGTDYRPMEQALRTYLEGGSYFKRTTPALLPGLDVKFRPAAAADRDFALLNLRWRVHRPADTAYRAHELLRLHPDVPRPHELLAAVAAADGDFATAHVNWERAAQLGTDNAFVYTQLAREALADFHGAAFLDIRLPADRIAELRHWTNRALALSPDDADALEASALTETLAAKIDIAAVNRAQARVLAMREPSRTLLALAIIRWRSGDPKTAADIVDLILSQRRADMPTRAAADLLRSRLPSTGGTADSAATPAPALTPEMLASRAAVSLHQGRNAPAAGVLLDRLLAERGTTAPRLQLPAVEVAVAKNAPAATDLWAQIDETRRRAAHGQADALFELALAHACGAGAEFSPELAAAWLEKAAAAGHPVALIGRRKDPAEAEAACQFLRMQRPLGPGHTRPPLDRDLAQLIAETLGAAPARALSIVHRSVPRYPEKLARAGLAGDALVHFCVDPRGQPQAITVVQATDDAFAAAAEDCVRQWRFLPAIRDQHAAATNVELPFRFRLVNAPAAPGPR